MARQLALPTNRAALRERSLWDSALQNKHKPIAIDEGEVDPEGIPGRIAKAPVFGDARVSIYSPLCLLIAARSVGEKRNLRFGVGSRF